MRFRILGPLEVFNGTHWRGISAAKPRTLLATLLVQRDVPVPTSGWARSCGASVSPRPLPI